MDRSAEVFAKRIKALRKEMDLPKVAVARAVDVSDRMVGHWECGASEPTLSNIAKLARFFQTTPNDLMGFGE